MSKLSELGEFGLIQQLARVVGIAAPPELVLGIGDDAAVWRAGNTYLIATTDTMVEGVHFLPSLAPWPDVGWKALAVNVSDMAAMGGEPLFALVTLALPPAMLSEAVEEMYEGLRDCALEYGVTIAGGDVVRAPQVSISIALIGRAEQEDSQPLLLRRDSARPGDLIAVTGSLGGSAAGLRRLQAGFGPEDPLARRHLRPRPPLESGRQAVRLGLRCGIDVSDGLLQDTGHICETSGLGADIEASAVPLDDALRGAYPEEALPLACGGGEDYELLLVGPEEKLLRLAALVLDRPVTIIGRMRDGEPAGRPPVGARAARLLDESGREIDVPATGWDQLRKRP